MNVLICGAGISGCSVSNILANSGHKVTIIDKKKHIGGLCYDGDMSGVKQIHKHGIHILRTNNDEVFKYLSKFTDWNLIEHTASSFIDGQYYPLPITRKTINKFFKIDLANEKELKNFVSHLSKNINLLDITSDDSETYLLNGVGRLIYEKFFKPYTMKQWGIHPSELPSSICARVPIRYTDDDRYFTQKYVGLPKEGYTEMLNKMLEHPNIKLILDADFKEFSDTYKESFDLIIYTGRIDEYYNYKFGKLPFRSLRFETTNYQDTEYYQKTCQVNYPAIEFDYTRKIEIKHLTKQKCKNTVVVTEYPSMYGEPMYPIPIEDNIKLYQRYKCLADIEDNVLFIGRLSEYLYLDMHQAIEKAIILCKQINNG